MSRDVVRGQMASQNANQPDLQGGSLNPQGSLPPHAPAGSLNASSSASMQQGESGNARSFVSQGDTVPPAPAGAQGHDGEEAQRGNTQLGVSGSHSMANQSSDFGGVHESNDAAGGLPRSPGNAGANAASSADRAGSQTGTGAADGGPAAHDSNDAAGGYPRSPGFANRLAGDQNMDDDTGFKRK